MSEDYRRLWKDVADTIDETKAIRTLSAILADKEGNTFVSRLERKDAELCIEILGRVSHDKHLLPFRRLRWFVGYRVVQPRTRRETGFLCHIEKTCRMPWTTARLDDDIRMD